MSDKSYSIDDILNEYPRSNEKATTDNNKNDLDVLLKSYEQSTSSDVSNATKTENEEKISLHNTDIFHKQADAPDLSDINISLDKNVTQNLVKQVEANSNNFERKVPASCSSITFF